MSKLIDLLDRIVQGAEEPLGFGARNAARTPSMALVALLPGATEALVEAALKAGADALILPTAGAASILPMAVDKANGRPVGITAHEGIITREEAESFKAQGADFGLIHPGKATLAVMALDLGWIMRVDNSFAPEELAALGSLDQVGAMAAAIAMGRASTEGPATYTMQDMMRLAVMVRVTRRPVLLPLQKPLPPEYVSAVHDAGAAGIIITPHVVEPVPSSVADLTRALREAIDRLPRSRPLRRWREEGLVPVVPQVQPSDEEME